MKRLVSRAGQGSGAEDSSVRPVAVGVGRSVPSQPPPSSTSRLSSAQVQSPRLREILPQRCRRAWGGVTRNAPPSIRDHRTSRRLMKKSKSADAAIHFAERANGSTLRVKFGVVHRFVTSPAPQHLPLIRSCLPRYARGRLLPILVRPPSQPISPHTVCRCGSRPASDTATYARWL